LQSTVLIIPQFPSKSPDLQRFFRFSPLLLSDGWFDIIKDSKKLSKRSISTRKYTLFSMYLCAATSLVLDSVVSLMEMGCSLKIFG
jgi:hypothetical protein